MIEVEIHPDASAEPEATEEFYESRLGGFGLRFLLAIESGIWRIEIFPQSESSLSEGFREVVVPGFPFSIVYQEAQDQIMILAVAHHYRLPGYWLNRSQ